MRRIKEPTASNIRRPRYLGAQLLIIDELRFQALDRRDVHRLFQIVNHRYERSSTIITSNKSITEWPTMLAGDEALAAAILDRLLHHCHAIQTDGASYRLRHIEQQLRLQPNGAGATNAASESNATGSLAIGRAGKFVSIDSCRRPGVEDFARDGAPSVEIRLCQNGHSPAKRAGRLLLQVG
jgi:hypothetical protein